MKIALVTGGNKGIGFEVCRNLAQAGCRVLLAARNQALGEAAAERLRQEGLSEVAFLELDTTKDQTVQAAARQIRSEHGHLDILVNNAGINVAGDGRPSAADLEVVRRVMDTNFIGTLRVTQAMLPLLKSALAGRIVNVSSELGSMTMNSNPEWEHYDAKLIGYNASKSAVNMLTVQLAWELKDTPIKVNTVNPGYTATDLNGHSGPQSIQEGAAETVRQSLVPDDAPTGGFFETGGIVPW